MEINKNFINDEILEFPDNYEEIANLALLNFEKENIIDLKKLLIKGLEEDKNNIKENNITEDKISKHEDDWEEFESDQEEKNLKVNNYQKFEDDDYSEEEKENDKKCEIIDENKEADKTNTDNNTYGDEKIVKNKDDPVNINYDEKYTENDKEKNYLKNNDKIQKKKLSNDKIREMISKIDYTPPNWARNLSDKEFIDKVKLYINKK